MWFIQSWFKAKHLVSFSLNFTTCWHERRCGDPSVQIILKIQKLTTKFWFEIKTTNVGPTLVLMLLNISQNSVRPCISHVQPPSSCPLCGESAHSAFKSAKFSKRRISERVDAVKKTSALFELPVFEAHRTIPHLRAVLPLTVVIVTTCCFTRTHRPPRVRRINLDS